MKVYNNLQLYKNNWSPIQLF